MAETVQRKMSGMWRIHGGKKGINWSAQTSSVDMSEIWREIRRISNKNKRKLQQFHWKFVNCMITWGCLLN